MDNSNSQLCNSCHIPSGQATITGHNQCADCHQTHNAPSAALLLNQPTVTDTCTVCHGSTLASLPSATPAAQLAGTGQINALNNRAAQRSGAAALSAAAPSIASDLQKPSRLESSSTPVLQPPSHWSIAPVATNHIPSSEAMRRHPAFLLAWVKPAE